MITTEVLFYKYITHWNLDQLFNEYIKSLVDPKFPLVASCTTGLTPPNKICRDFFVDKKKKGKPSELKTTNRDSLVSYAAKILGLNGHVSTVVAECSGSSYSIYTATLLSQVYKTPAIVFCADNMIDDELQMWRFNSFGALDQNTGRSFDRSSKGFRMGLGAGIFLVKHPEVKFDLPTLATISNYNFYTDPALIVNPGNVENLINNLNGIDFSSIDLWNAHATGTPVGDQFEYDLFSKVIKHNAPIIGYKGHVGHCIAASGLIELGMMFDDYMANSLRPNNILDEPIVNDDRIIRQSTKFSYRKILKVNLGFGGKNVVCQVNIQ